MEAALLDECLFLFSPFLLSGRSLSDMERLIAFVLSNFSTIVIFSSLGWCVDLGRCAGRDMFADRVDRMFLRAYRVLSKPSQDLIDLLGIEVPSAPALALHGIKADGVILNWKAPDLQKSSSVKYSLFINGINGLYIWLARTELLLTIPQSASCLRRRPRLL
jgi:hypothetical protein